MAAGSLLRRIADALERACRSDPDALIVVGVSGGVDSMVLLDALVRLDRPVLVAHVNYGLRGEASEADEALVRTRCAELQVPLETARYETRAVAESRARSIQETARDLRYAFFAEVAASAGAPFVAVGHHADDQAETLLLNLFRGTGIEGLAAMPYARPISADLPVELIRPLLDVRRRDLEAYAREHDLPWREDASNESADYLRNVIRHRILPLVIETFDAGVPARIARAAGFLRAYLDECLEPALRKHFETCAEPRRTGGLLREEALAALEPGIRGRIVLEALSRWIPSAPRDVATTARIDALRSSQVGRHLPLAGGIVWREREGLLFERTDGATNLPESVTVPLAEGSYAVPGGQLTIQHQEAPVAVQPLDPDTIVLNAGARGPLTVRTWDHGDAMQPFGMTGHRKVSDILTDAKVPSHERSRILVVSMENEVVWIPGVRASERTRADEHSGAAWMLRYTPIPDQNL